MNPLVTIITSTLNIIKAGREKSFRQCIESIHEQTYKNIEHIIIDGSSVDGTLNVIKEYVDKGWIKYISEADQGIYDAMNKGIKMAHGKYIAFINSDDYYHNKKGVEMSVEMLEKNGADFSYAPVINFDEKLGIKYLLVPDIHRIFFSIVPNHQTMFVKKDIIIKEGFFKIKYKNIAEYDLNICFCLKKYKSIFIKKDFVTYRLGGNSAEATKQGIIFKEICNIYYENYNKLCPMTIEECEKISQDAYGGSYNLIPKKLAEKLKDNIQYFDYKKYVEETKPINKFKENIKKYLKIIIPLKMRPVLKKIYYFFIKSNG